MLNAGKIECELTRTYAHEQANRYKNIHARRNHTCHTWWQFISFGNKVYRHKESHIIFNLMMMVVMKALMQLTAIHVVYALVEKSNSTTYRSITMLVFCSKLKNQNLAISTERKNRHQTKTTGRLRFSLNSVYTHRGRERERERSQTAEFFSSSGGGLRCG